MKPCSPQGGRRWAPSTLIVTAVLGATAVVPAGADAAGPPSSASTAAAAGRYHRADAAVVTTAKRLAACQQAAGQHSATCTTRRAALQAAGLRLSAAQIVLAHKASTPRLSARQKAPVLIVTGQQLSWAKVADVGSYVLVRKIAGQTDRYSVVTGTSTTPPAAPGETVRYGLRTAVVGSAWAREAKISYPSLTSGTTPVTTVDGQTGPTQPTTSPAPATGSQPPAPPASGGATDPSPPPAASAGGFRAGIVSGSAINWELSFVKQLGAKAARMEFDISTPASQLEPYVDNYAKAGIQPLLLAGFKGRSPTAAEARNLATWAAEFGPGGTFWQGKGYDPSTAVTRIEFGNESNQSWQYPALSGDSTWPSSAYYANLATQYALRFRDAATSIEAANPKVGLLAVGDTPGNWASWMDNVFAAVPNFGSYVSGWVVHPYGPVSRWRPDIDNALAQVAAHGASSAIPIVITEYGIATDNGRCLDDNYGWDTCMTYDQAGAALTSSVAAMRSRYGSRLQGLYLYQAHDQKDPSVSVSREGYFGGLTLRGTAKGSFTTAVKSVLAG